MACHLSTLLLACSFSLSLSTQAWTVPDDLKTLGADTHWYYSSSTDSPIFPSFHCVDLSGRLFCLGYVYHLNHNLKESVLQNNYYQSVVRPMTESSKDMSSMAKQEKGNGLILYLNNYSFYAQKVIMAMVEKKVAFKPQIVNIAKGEQYQPWFLDINPRGEVPVLKDGVKVIPDSARIIDYLEDNFSNGESRLLPQGGETRQRVLYFRNLLDPIPANVITIGSIFHPKFVGTPRAPFIGPVRRSLADSEEKNVANLRKLAEQYPDFKNILLEKAEVQEKKHHIVKNKAAFAKLLDQVDLVLQEVEKELSSRKEDDTRWLCSEMFTIADISLTILLDRLYLLGLDTWFWADGKKPGIAHYYTRVRLRHSYKLTVPTPMTHLRTVLDMQSGFTIGTVICSAVALVLGGLLFLKKK